MTWLNDFYKSADGLQRPEGLWLHDRPDWEGLSVWVFSVYLPHRLKGEIEDQARQAVSMPSSKARSGRSSIAGNRPKAKLIKIDQTGQYLSKTTWRA